MGWLLAVAMGMQEDSGRAVLRSLLPLGAGHLAAVALAVVGLVAVGLVVPFDLLRTLVGIGLILFGGYRLVRQRHPRYGGMRMGAAQLMLWSFLMASAHGAGLMVVPFVMGRSGGSGSPALGLREAVAGHPETAALAVLVHTTGYLVVTATAAGVVFGVVGVAFLRRAWLNLDYLWAAALIGTGVFTLLW
ncbi:MAG TPA: hypothetical protein VE173_14335 [Longimicrobiales bacterium]|nr:hypothetical protein [Longimicrobiales bacterium]